MQPSLLWLQMHRCFYLFLHRLFMNFHAFSSLDFDVAFWSGLWWNNCPKWHQKSIPRATFFIQKGSKCGLPHSRWSVLEPTFYRASIFRCSWVAFGLHFGAYWVLLATMLHHLCKLSLHFGRSSLNFCINIYDLLLFSIEFGIELRSSVFSRIISS